MANRLRRLLDFPVRTWRRAALSAALVIVLGLGGWYGLRVLRFQRDQEKARAALTNYDFPEARSRLSACLAFRPRDPATLLLATQAARRDGQLDEADGYLERYQTLVPTSTPEGALQWALLRVQRGLVKEHVRDLLEYIEVRHPETEQILEALAQGCVHVYRLDEATFWTKQLLDRYPQNAVGRLLNSQTLETLRRRPRALEIARQLVEDHPNYDKARLFLSELLVKDHQYEEAVEQYRELHRRQPTEERPLLGLVRTLLTLDRIEEAEPLLLRLEKEHGDRSESLLECGRFALRQSRPADAEPLLARAVVLAPNDHEVHYELAVSLNQLGRQDEAARHLERFKQIQADMMQLEKVFQAMVKAPSDPEPRLQAGRLCLRNGQVSEGLRWLYGILDLVPYHQAAHETLAEHFTSAGENTRAEVHRKMARGRAQ